MAARIPEGRGEVHLGAALATLLVAPFLVNLRLLTEIEHPAHYWGDLFAPRTLDLLSASIALSALVVAGSLLLATAAVILYLQLRSAAPRLIFLFGAGWTFCLSPVVHLAAWQMIGSRTGLPPLASTAAILSWSYFPIPFFLLLLGMGSLERSGIEFGLLAGRRRGVMRFLVLPRLLPVMAASGLLVFLFAFMQSEVPSLTNYPVYPEEFLARIVLAERGAAVGLAAPQIAAVLILLPVLFSLGKDLLQGDWREGGLAALVDGFPRRGMLVMAAFLLPAALFASPLILLVQGKFTGFLSKNGTALTTSAVLGLISAGGAALLAHFIADGILAAGERCRLLLLGGVLLPLLLPGPLFGLGMIEIAQWPGLYWLTAGDGLLVLTHALRIAPLLVLLLEGVRRQARQAEKDDSRTFGISWFARQRYLRFPREWPQLVLAGGVGFALILAELSTTILIVAPGTETSVLRLYNQMHYGDWSSVAALAFAQALLAASVFPLAMKLGWRHDPS